MNKLEESCIVIAQQQLEALDQMINILKNKNKDDKMETLKKNNIQKCILWCEKFKIPHNKFIEKLNIFLINNTSKNVKDLDLINIDIDIEEESVDVKLDLDLGLELNLEMEIN